MALVQARKSDKSGLMIPPGSGARVRIEFYDAEKRDKIARRADLTDEEVEEVLGFAQEVEVRTARKKRTRANL